MNWWKLVVSSKWSYFLMMLGFPAYAVLAVKLNVHLLVWVGAACMGWGWFKVLANDSLWGDEDEGVDSGLGAEMNREGGLKWA